MAIETKRTIVVIGWILVAVAFACLFAVALIATLQGGGPFGVDYQRSGRLAFFIPVAYVPLLIAALGVAVYWLWRKAQRAKRGKEASNSTPHADARASTAPNNDPSARAGGRRR
jgi:H+/Cl- antiporter ClcA